MSHGIEKSDLVISTHSTEWHGLAHIYDEINDEILKPLLFDIVESPIYTKIGDREVMMPDRKTLIADLSPRNLYEENHAFYLPEDELYVPMHTPKSTYGTITNNMVWESLKLSLKDAGIDAKIVTAGTLENCSKFFMSVDIGNSEIKIGNNDKILSHLAFVTSHTGELAFQAYDTSLRIVCMNTLRSSMNAAGDVEFKVFHTKNSPLAMKKFPELLNAILQGRVAFRNNLEFFNQYTISFDDAKYAVLSFLSDKNEASTQAINMSSEIQHLFKNGLGNNGNTLYDLLNGFTEAYTHGSGTGKNSNDLKKRFKADFGVAAEKKNEFMDYLIANHNTFDVEIQRGKKLLEAYDIRKVLVEKSLT